MSSKSSCSSPELQAKPPTLPQDVQHLPLYGIFTPSVLPPSDPLKALRRDAVANRAVAEQKTTIRNLRPLYETQLEQLEEFIGLQKNSQNLLKKNYAALRQAYFKKGKELEELRSRISGVDVVKLIAENKKLEDNCKKQMHLRLLAEDTVKKLTQIVKAKLTELAQCHDRLANLKHDKASLMAELKALKERQQHPRQPPPPPLELLTSSSEILSTERNTPSSVETRLGFESLGTPNSPPKFRRPPLPTQVVIPMDGSHKRCLSENPDVKPSAGAQLSVVSAPSKSSKNHNRSTSYPPCISIKDRHSENTASSTIPHPTVADKQGPICIQVVAKWRANLGKTQLRTTERNNCVLVGHFQLEPVTSWKDFEVLAISTLDKGMHSIFSRNGAEAGLQTEHLLGHANPGSFSASPSKTSSSRKKGKLTNGQLSGEDRISSDVKEFQLGPINWNPGCTPKFPAEAGSSKSSAVASNGSMDDSDSPVSLPYHVCLKLIQYPSTSSSEVQALEEGQKPVNARSDKKMSVPVKLTLLLGSVASASLDCGVPMGYIQHCLHLIKTHAGLIWSGQSARTWTNYLVHTMASLFYMEIKKTAPRNHQVIQHTLEAVDISTKSGAFRLSDWLFGQGLIKYQSCNGTTEKKENEVHSKSLVLILDSIAFLDDPENSRELLYLLNLIPTQSAQPIWRPLVDRVYIIGRVLQPLRNLENEQISGINEWIRWPILPEQPNTEISTLLFHNLNITQPPLVGVIPTYLRLKAFTIDEGKINENRGEGQQESETFCARRKLLQWVENIWHNLMLSNSWFGLMQDGLSGILDLPISRPTKQPPSTTLELTDPNTDDLISSCPVIPPIPAGCGRTNELDRNHAPKRPLSMPVFSRKDSNSEQDALLRILDPDIFLTCPGLRLNQPNQEIDQPLILSWLEKTWNRVWEPELQASATLGSSVEQSPAKTRPLSLLADRMAWDKMTYTSRTSYSDAAASVLIRQIMLPECPLTEPERKQFLSRLAGGATSNNSKNHSPHRMTFETILSTNATKGSRTTGTMPTQIQLHLKDKEKQERQFSNAEVLTANTPKTGQPYRSNTVFRSFPRSVKQRVRIDKDVFSQSNIFDTNFVEQPGNDTGGIITPVYQNLAPTTLKETDDSGSPMQLRPEEAKTIALTGQWAISRRHFGHRTLRPSSTIRVYPIGRRTNETTRDGRALPVRMKCQSYPAAQRTPAATERR